MSEFENEDAHSVKEEEEFYEEEGEYEYRDSSTVELSEFDRLNKPLNSLELIHIRRTFEEKDRMMRESKKAATAAHSLSTVGKVNRKNCFSEDASFQVLFNEFSLIKQNPDQNICIEVLNENLYHWRARIRNFEYTTPFGLDLIEKEIDEVVLEIEFVQDLYPFYPPRVTIISPRLKDNLLYHISNLFILRFESWNPSNRVLNIIHDIKTIIERFGKIDKESPTLEFSSLEKHLLHLSFITDVKPQCIVYDDFITDSFYSELRTQLNELKKVKIESVPSISSGAGGGAGNATPSSGWAKGTGYGGDRNKYTEVWDVQKAALLEEERDRTFFTLFDLINDDITQEIAGGKQDFAYSSIMNSSLITNIEHYLIQDSMISKSSIKVANSFKILKTICSSEGLIYLIKRIYPQLYKVYMENKKIVERISASAASAGGEDDGFEMIQTYYENLSFIISIVQSMNLHDNFMDTPRTSEEAIAASNELEAKYIHMMKEIQVGELTDLPGYHYRSQMTSDSALTSLPRGLIQRVSKEIFSMNTSLPASLSSTIWLRTIEDRFLYAQVLISGPDDTPYSGGLYLFDVYFPTEYPNVSPKVNLQTTGGGKVRFNPNLYNCGKVCLSLLGTWRGDSSENWNPKVSTFLQVLISIQALILIPEPYFNEPGYQSSMGSPSGQAQSRAYNENIRKQNVRYAINEQIRNPPRGYEEIVHKHFSLQKTKILKTIEGWKDGSSEWTQLYTEAQQLMESLPEF